MITKGVEETVSLSLIHILIYGETLEQGAHRILRQTLPTAPLDHLHCNLMYHFENEATNRLVYLFTLDLDEDLPMKRGTITSRNKFIRGPSGSGKSYLTNPLVRQYWEQRCV